MANQGGSQRDEVESLYAEWREQERSGDIEELCARHPERAAALRRLHSKFDRVELLLGADPESDTMSSSGGTAGPFEALVTRLGRRRPQEDRYQEREEVGRGGMGSVLEAFDVDLRRSVAKKVMLGPRSQAQHESPGDSTPLGRFCEEAQITAQLTHPGVVPVHELGLDDQGRVFFTMDLVRGRTLRPIFELAREGRGGWTLARAVGVIERVCETLAYAHSRGVIHRDVKPGNVMVGEFGEVYVMDWGLAKLVGETPATEAGPDQAGPAVSTDRRDASDRDTFAGLRTETGAAAGTPGFMSPEQARGDVHALDERTDVYSVGALLYSLLTGVRPFEAELQGDNIFALLDASRRGAFTPIAQLAPEASPELVSIAERAMETEPAQRYANAEAMARDLRAWLEGRVVVAHESGAWPELRKWVGRNKALAAAVLAALVAVTGGAAGMAVFEREGRLGVEREELIGKVSAAPTRVSGLLAEAEVLWPSTAERVPALERWLDEKDELLASRGLLADALAGLRGETSSFSEGELDVRLLGRLSSAADRLDDLERSTPWIAQRLEIARSLQERSVGGGEALRRWRGARVAIESSGAYAGLSLEPQVGLLPLREDPRSGLWEFWHIPSGEEPRLDPATDAWRVDGETGVVLVLVPGGSSRVGTPIVPREHPLYDDCYEFDQEDSDPTVHEVQLDPFFISKYELTQGQWRRARGVNSSQGRLGSEAHPADTVSWDGAVETLAKFDLTLPTEAQWEVAGRGGKATRFYTGQSRESLTMHAILFPDFDLDYQPDRDEQGRILEVYGRPWRPHHEPVGTTSPNPYGLHEVHGNVQEWCLDVYEYSAAPRPGDGLRTRDGSRSAKRVLRGGSYTGDWTATRLAYRFPWEKQNSEPDTGVRPARAIR